MLHSGAAFWEHLETCLNVAGTPPNWMHFHQKESPIIKSWCFIARFDCRRVDVMVIHHCSILALHKDRRGLLYWNYWWDIASKNVENGKWGGYRCPNKGWLKNQLDSLYSTSISIYVYDCMLVQVALNFNGGNDHGNHRWIQVNYCDWISIINKKIDFWDSKLPEARAINGEGLSNQITSR